MNPTLIGFIKKEQRDRVALTRSQAGSVAIDKIVEVTSDLLDLLPSLGTNKRGATQRAGYGCL